MGTLGTMGGAWAEPGTFRGNVNKDRSQSIKLGLGAPRLDLGAPASTGSTWRRAMQRGAGRVSQRQNAQVQRAVGEAEANRLRRGGRMNERPVTAGRAEAIFMLVLTFEGI